MGTRTICLLIGMLGASPLFAEQNPEYESGKLLIPSVDAQGQPGFFQDVVVQSAGNDLWRVTEIYDGIPIRRIEKVEVIKTDSFPVQIFLKVTGIFYNGCQQFGKVRHQLDGNTFNVFAYYLVDKFPPGTVACTADVTSFSKTIPLPVYGLAAGEYAYTFNKNFSGTFVLNSNNTL